MPGFPASHSAAALSLPRLLPAACLMAGLLAAPMALAQGGSYTLDPVHTRVVFSVSHAGFSDAVGTVSGSTGSLWFDPDDWRSARLQARIPITRVDLGDDKWNRASLAGNLLDAQAHPQATFVSTRIEPVDPTRARVHGNLTLRGVTREVVLDVRLNAAKRHPLPPFRRTVGFSATTALRRADFGMTAWKSVIGDQVQLRIEVEATRTRNPDDRDDDSGAQAPAPSPADPPAPDAAPATPPSEATP